MKCSKCNKHNPRKIDYCMVNICSTLKQIGFKVVASCCGHGIYPITIVINAFDGNYYYDLTSLVKIPRKKRFYKKDKEGYYYIPEVVR